MADTTRGETDHHSTAPQVVETFLRRWGNSGAAERANYQLFLSELCDLLNVPRPEPTKPDDRDNAYVFERYVTFAHGDGTTSTGRIDLYKRNCFVLEAKQGSAAAAVAAADHVGLLLVGFDTKNEPITDKNIESIESYSAYDDWIEQSEEWNDTARENGRIRVWLWMRGTAPTSDDFDD